MNFFTARLMEPGEREASVKLASRFPLTRDFGYVWTRFHNWEPAPPIVVVDTKGTLAGLHAVTLGKRSLYVNSYYLVVAEEFQGQGVAGQTVAFLLPRAVEAGMRRIKLKCRPSGPGEVFWRGFGLRPLGTDGKDLVFDEDLGGEPDVTRWVEWNTRRRKEHAPVPEKQLAAYVKKGLRLFRGVR